MVSRTYQDIHVYETFAAQEYGSYLKLLVSTMVDNCPNLSVRSVTTDTTSKYDVTLKWSATDTILLRIYNNSDNVYTQWVYASSGKAFKNSSASYVCYLNTLQVDGVTQYVADAYVTISQIGDFLNTVAVYTTADKGYFCINFNWAYSTEMSKKVFFVECSVGTSSNKPSYSHLTMPTSAVLYGDNTLYSSNISGSIQDVGYFPNTSNYYLRPLYNYGYLNVVNLSLGNLIWGGLYDLYMLCAKGGSAVSTNVDGYYTVNDETYMGCSTVLYIPEPSIYLK